MTLTNSVTAKKNNLISRQCDGVMETFCRLRFPIPKADIRKCYRWLQNISNFWRQRTRFSWVSFTRQILGIKQIHLNECHYQGNDEYMIQFIKRWILECHWPNYNCPKKSKNNSVEVDNKKPNLYRSGFLVYEWIWIFKFDSKDWQKTRTFH